MADETLEVIIHADGRVELKVEGVKGPHCTVITESIESALGGEVSREYTPEYYEQKISQKKQQRLG